MVDPLLSRVGKRVIRDSQIIQELQRLMPDKTIQFAIGCRGSSRTIAPSEDTAHLEVPFRKCAFLKRGTNRIFVEDQWENWSELSKRQRVRPSHACRINITVFACNPVESPDAAGSEASPSTVPEPTTSTMMPTPTELPVPGANGTEAHEPSARVPIFPSNNPNHNSSNPINESTNVTPQSTVIADERKSTTMDGNVHHHKTPQQHATMQALSKEDQSLLMKIHKSLGHPNPERLSTMMLKQGYRPELARAARHFRCDVCIQNSQPKAARPSTLRDDLEFNDRVSVDGFSWTNQKGQVFHMYHVLDWGTNFHMASIAPSRSTEDFIKVFMNMWLSWAGSPGEILVDAGSEFNSEEFMEFLQSHNIRGTTISPEAHFQNGRSEQPGAILQTMLSKFSTEHEIASYTDLQKALWWCVQAKNACSLKGGYAPEVLVLGKHTRLPGSVSSDMLLPAHVLAESEHAQGLKFRSQLAMREAARRAFHCADNDASLRRAMLRRSHPHRGQYQPGEWVMAWREGHGQNTGYWQGPMKVVVHENQQTVWLTMSSKLFRCAPEHVRPVTSDEAKGITWSPDEPSISEIARQLPRENEGGITRVINLGGSSAMEMPIVSLPGLPQPEANAHAPSSKHSGVEEQPDQEPDLPSTPSQENQDREPEETPIPDEPEDVPIPDDDDGDDLVCEGLYCHDVDSNALETPEDGMTWRCEVLVSEADIQAWRDSPDPEEMSFLVSAAKRQRAEVKLTELTASERAEFQVAKEAEVSNWLKTGTVQKMLRSQLAPEQVLRCRWVLTWKPIEESDRDPSKPNNTRKAKARLVVLGYLDPQITEIPHDSPTLNRHSKMLLLQLIASKSWNLRSFDIRAAFLQGKPQQGRVGTCARTGSQNELEARGDLQTFQKCVRSHRCTVLMASSPPRRTFAFGV